MLRSMTGFGAAQAEVQGVSYAVEARSVNNRYFKLTTKLPEMWAAAESEIDKRVRRHIQRGSVVLSVRMRIPEDQAAWRVNTAALRAYLEQLAMVEINADPQMRIDLGSMLSLPGVCEPPATDELCQTTRDGLMQLVDKALDDLTAMRSREGEALREDLLGQCDVIESNLAAVRQRVPEVVKDYQQRLATRVQDLLDGGRANLDADVLAREVALFAERSDVAEEVQRLAGHVEQFRQSADSTEPAGRKLDFIAQEMLREANTIGSKANDAQIARAVLEIKTAVDRIKEQAANAE